MDRLTGSERSAGNTDGRYSLRPIDAGSAGVFAATQKECEQIAGAPRASLRRSTSSLSVVLCHDLIFGWHALRYSEGRAFSGQPSRTPFGVPQGVPPDLLENRAVQ